MEKSELQEAMDNTLKMACTILKEMGVDIEMEIAVMHLNAVEQLIRVHRELQAIDDLT